MNFYRVATVFEEINATSGRNEITKMLADLFKDASVEEMPILCNLSLGMLRPIYLGTQFNIAEKNICTVLAILFDTSEKKIKDESSLLGDWGSVIDHKGFWNPSTHYSVEDIYADLCALQQAGGKGSQEEKKDQLLKILKKVSPLEGKYIIRIILGTLRLGFSDMTLIDALSWMQVCSKALRDRIEHAYNICVDIGLIAARLKRDGIEALDAMNIIVGIPIRPAAAERLPTAQAIFEKLGPCVAQPKLDGFRLQVHINKKNNESIIKFYSRNLIDMSAMFPDIVVDLQNLDVQNLIVEGEAIAYNPDTGTFLPFQQTVKRKRKHNVAEVATEYPLKLFMFDLLYLNDKSYLAEAHSVRRAVLCNLFKGFASSVVSVIQEVAISSTQDLQEYYLKNIEQGLEGLVVKKQDSIYRPGKRNFSWIKLKRHTEGHLEDTLDCVIIGYYQGLGKRSSFGIGAFLVGVFNEKKDCFQTVAKVGTGLTDSEFRELKLKCDKERVSQMPHNVECTKELYPDVWCNPIIVCMIRADEITLSPLHTAGKTDMSVGYALRFPRFMGYRPDKSPEQATSVDEIKRLYDDQFIM